MNFVMGYGISSHTVSLLQEPKANMASIEGIMVINSAMRFIVTGLFVILSYNNNMGYTVLSRIAVTVENSDFRCS